MTEVHHLHPLVTRWSRHTQLSQDDREAIFALPAVHRSYGKEAYLVREGLETTDCNLLLKGFAFRHKLLRNGARQIISIHIPTEFVDLQNSVLSTADHNVQSLNRTEVAIISRNALMEIAEERPAVRMAMWVDTLLDSSIFREWVVNVGRRDSRARIAHLLCELASRLESIGLSRDGMVDFPITQEQIADCTGLTAVHTNRTVQALRKDGLIQLAAGSLTVLNWDGLRTAGDFDELYLHQNAT